VLGPEGTHHAHPVQQANWKLGQMHPVGFLSRHEARWAAGESEYHRYGSCGDLGHQVVPDLVVAHDRLEHDRDIADLFVHLEEKCCGFDLDETVHGHCDHFAETLVVCRSVVWRHDWGGLMIHLVAADVLQP
jgi:hypothetical protein